MIAQVEPSWLPSLSRLEHREGSRGQSEIRGRLDRGQARSGLASTSSWYNAALKNQPFTREYIDAFAGTGYREVRDEGRGRAG